MKSIAAVVLCLLTTTSLGAFAAGGVVKSPTGVAPDRYVYYPGTEALDRHMEKYDLQDQDWRPGMMKMIKGKGK